VGKKIKIKLVKEEGRSGKKGGRKKMIVEKRQVK
jgi:hypothetical protein